MLESTFSKPIKQGSFISSYYSRLLTFELKWADTSILCVRAREIFPPSMCSILWIESWKPISRVLSASSNTKALTFSSLKLFVCYKWYNRRPGVQNKMLVPFLSLDFSWLVSSPPYKHPEMMNGHLFKHRLAYFWPCTHSSRVGHITIMPVPSSRLVILLSWMILLTRGIK